MKLAPLKENDSLLRCPLARETHIFSSAWGYSNRASITHRATWRGKPSKQAMNETKEAYMDPIRRAWGKIERFLEALHGMDDPGGEYLSFLSRRIDKLELELAELKRHQGAGGISDTQRDKSDH